MARLLKIAVALGRQDDAATIVEYTLMMMLVAASCYAAVTSFGSAISGLIQRAVNAFPH